MDQHLADKQLILDDQKREQQSFELALELERREVQRKMEAMQKTFAREQKSLDRDSKRDVSVLARDGLSHMPPLPRAAEKGRAAEPPRFKKPREQDWDKER